MTDYREDARWSVYIHIVPKSISGYKNDKYYVGITSMDVKRRWGKNGKGYDRGKNQRKIFWQAICKYGWNNIEHYVIASNLTENEAKDMEISLIATLNSHGKMGYNLTDGGDGMLGTIPKSTKKIYMFDLDGKHIKTYDGWRFIKQELDISEHIIKRAIKSHNQLIQYFFCYENQIRIVNGEIEIKDFDTYKYSGFYVFDLEGYFIEQFEHIRDISDKYHISSKAITNQTAKHKTPGNGIFYIFRLGKDVYRKNNTYCIKNFMPPDIYIYKFDLDGNFIKRFDCSSDVIKEDCIDRVTLFHHLHNDYTQYNKFKNPYIYKYYKDINYKDGEYSYTVEKILPQKRLVNHGRSIYSFDPITHEFIKKYISISEACREWDSQYDTIADIAKRKRFNPRKVPIFRFKEDVQLLDDGTYKMLA